MIAPWDGGCQVIVPHYQSKHAELTTYARLLTAFPGSCGKKVQAFETPWETSINSRES